MKGGKKAVMTALAVILVVFMSFPTVFAARAAEAVPEAGEVPEAEEVPAVIPPAAIPAVTPALIRSRLSSGMSLWG